MAVVKLNYIRKNKHALAVAKRTLLYNETRKGKNQENVQRVLFSHGGELTEAQAIKMLDEKPKEYYYWRVIVSPDPGIKEDQKKDLDMREIIKQTILTVETFLNMEGKIDFVAAEHNDHTDKRHIHAIMLLPRITREQFDALSYVPRDGATKEALLQREALDLYTQAMYRESRQNYQFVAPDKMIGSVGARATKKARQPVLACPDGLAHKTVKTKSGKSYCMNCERVVEREQGLSL
jgi:hypothetical protein